MKKNTILITATIITALLLVVIGSAGMLLVGNQTNTYRISVIVNNSSADSWASFKAGLNQAASDYDVQLNYVLTSNFADAEEENEQIRREANNNSNAMIIEPYNTYQMQEELTSVASNMPIALVISTAVLNTAADDNVSKILFNDSKIGTAVASELHIRYDAFPSTMKIGVVTGNIEQSSLQERLTAFQTALEKNGGQIAWQVTGTADLEEKIKEEDSAEPVNVIVGLDNMSLEAAADYASEQDRHISVFGAGNSTNIAYYLGNGVITSLIVPDYYNMGYQSVVSVVWKLNHTAVDSSDYTCTYSVVDKDNMYSEKNEKLLFPIVQ